MIDIHSHILWGMDDGSTSESISLEMLRLAAEAGTTDIVATPHSNAEFEYHPVLISQRIEELTQKTKGSPRIHRGCDLHLSFDNIADALENHARYTINGHHYLLVECSDFAVSSSIDRILNALLKADLVPVVTHPERNPILQKDLKKVERWVEEGALVQVTGRSVVGGFGKTAAAVSHQLLSMGLVHVIASDAHDPVHRHPKLDEAFAIVQEKYGRELAELLFVSIPGHIIRGKWFDAGKTIVKKEQKWWHVWN